jgi:uncharacterized protein YndB with AHSA1/START domain
MTGMTEMPDMDESGEATDAELDEVSQEEGISPFVINRLFDAPRQLLFAAWTEEEHLKNWFAPNGFEIPVCTLNLAPGGAFHYCMRAPNGVEMWGKWVFEEIVPLERIVLVNSFSNKHGNLTRHPYVPGWPLELLTTTTFGGEGNKTLLKLAWLPIHATAKEKQTFESMRSAMSQGWNGTLNQLAEYLATL